MVEKFFLALDYSTRPLAESVAMNAFDFIEKNYGLGFINSNMGVKINQDLLMMGVIPRQNEEDNSLSSIYLAKRRMGYQIFNDLKIAHGADTGRRIIERTKEFLPMEYVTVATDLGTGVLKEYANIGKELGVKIIGFTKHTKTSPEDVQRDHNKTLADVIYTRALMASEAGLDAAVMEANMLKDERIAKLPIKKLVTGIRIDVQDAGTQKRVSSLEDVANVKPFADYVVVSSRYLSNNDLLKQVIDTLM
jgi:orotidine-5'-phosphate decarboxylase